MVVSRLALVLGSTRRQARYSLQRRSSHDGLSDPEASTAGVTAAFALVIALRMSARTVPGWLMC